LYFRAVQKHRLKHFSGCLGAKNFSLKTALHEIGRIAGMVNMGMADNKRVNGAWIKGKFTVYALHILPPALVESAFKQYFLAIICYEMLGACHTFARSEKFNLYHSISIVSNKNSKQKTALA